MIFLVFIVDFYNGVTKVIKPIKPITQLIILKNLIFDLYVFCKSKVSIKTKSKNFVY